MVKNTGEIRPIGRMDLDGLLCLRDLGSLLVSLRSLGNLRRQLLFAQSESHTTMERSESEDKGRGLELSLDGLGDSFGKVAESNRTEG
jgi:hypothetical protein